MAIYLGLVFVISGAALLALKELSDAIDGREKYRILQQLGVSEKELGHTLFLQMAVFFAFPLLLAMHLLLVSRYVLNCSVFMI